MAQYKYDWERKFGVDGRDEARDLVETYDDGIVLAGHTIRKAKKFVWLLKIDADGYPVWGRTYERSGNDAAESIIETSDSCMVVAGSSWAAGGENLDFWVFKVDSAGNTIWEKTYGGVFDDEALAVIETQDGNLVAAGYTNTMDNSDDLAIKKIAPNGDLIWEQSVGGKKSDRLFDIVESSDGSLLTAGYYGTKAKALKSFYVARFDDLGQLIWGEHFNENHTEVSIAKSLIELDNDEIVAVGFDKSKDTMDFNMKVVKCDPNGMQLKSKVYNITLEDKNGKRLMRDSILTKFLTDSTFSDSLKRIAYVLKDLNWGEATSLTKTYDGNIAITGFSQDIGGNKSDFWIVKVDKSLEVMWDMVLNRSSLDYANAIIETHDKGLVVSGCTYAKGDISWDFAVLKYGHYDTLTISLNYPWAMNTVAKTDSMLLDFCVESILPVSDITIHRNDSVFKHTIVPPVSRNPKACKYTVNQWVELEHGRNTFYITIINPANIIHTHKFDIYYLPILKYDW